MMSITCDYHPSRNAVEKCERCNRTICLDDKMIYRKTRSRGTGNTRHTYQVKYTYCPLCHAEVTINENTGVNRAFQLGITGFVVLFAIFWTVTASQFAPFMAIFGLVFLGFGVYQLNNIFVNGPKKVEVARRAEQEFLNSLNSLPKGLNQVRSYSKYEGYTSYKKSVSKSLVSLTCFECGSGIEADSNFCMNCGSDTEDERRTSKQL